jgi:hypothetical protein
MVDGGAHERYGVIAISTPSRLTRPKTEKGNFMRFFVELSNGCSAWVEADPMDVSENGDLVFSANLLNPLLVISVHKWQLAYSENARIEFTSAPDGSKEPRIPARF